MNSNFLINIGEKCSFEEIKLMVGQEEYTTLIDFGTGKRDHYLRHHEESHEELYRQLHQKSLTTSKGYILTKYNNRSVAEQQVHSYVFQEGIVDEVFCFLYSTLSIEEEVTFTSKFVSGGDQFELMETLDTSFIYVKGDSMYFKRRSKQNLTVGSSTGKLVITSDMTMIQQFGYEHVHVNNRLTQVNLNTLDRSILMDAFVKG